MSKKNNSKGNVVYSTNPNFKPEEEDDAEDEEAPPANDAVKKDESDE